MIHIQEGHAALLSSGHPVFPGFNDSGLSFRVDRDGETAATYAVATMFLGDQTLREFLEGHSWRGVDHDVIRLTDEATAVADGVTGAVGFIGGLWVRPDLRRTDFSEWCKIDLPTLAMKECDRRYKLDAYFFFVQNIKVGEAAKPDHPPVGHVWWHRATEDGDPPARYLGVVTAENVRGRADPSSWPH